MDAPDIRTFAGANWTGYGWTPDRTTYARRADAPSVWTGAPSAPADRRRFQTRGSLRVVKIGSICPECWQTFRRSGGCGCD